ncbi:MAG: M48 family metalloprotease [Deltaproteobacteria bacterium]|nr:M48 family metalloprotease [Deltaproteobacteria bacterium]
MTIKKLFIFSIALFIILTPLEESRASLLSPEEETELGARFLKRIRSQYAFADYPYIVQYINDLGNYIGRQIEVPYFPLHFYVIKDTAINAFAAPAGHVFFFSGLIKIMDNVDELASVLAHELGHVSARHLALRIERSKKIGMATMAAILAGVLIGGEATGAVMTGSIAAGVQAELGYSREDERQADQLGFKYTHMSGFNPQGMITTLKKIQRENWYGGQNIPPYLLTHPGASERMANIETMAREYKKIPDSDTTKKLRSHFPIFHTMVIALCDDKENAAREFKKRLAVEPESILAHYGLGLVLERDGKIHEALDHFKIALKRKGNSIPIMFSMAKAYQTIGQYQESVSILQKALHLSSKDKDILYLLALSFQDLERYDQASRIYERLTFLPPVKDMVYYNLGLVYGRQGKLALAHYNLGIYSNKLGRKKNALFHFNKAKELAESEPALKEKINKALKVLTIQKLAKD